MIPVPLYPNGYPCKCSSKCDYSKAFEEAGMPSFIDYEKYIAKDFEPVSNEEKLIYKYLKTTYCLNK